MNYFSFKLLHDLLISKNTNYLIYEESGMILGTVDIINKKYISFLGVKKIILINLSLSSNFDDIQSETIFIDVIKFLKKYPYLQRKYNINNYFDFFVYLSDRYNFVGPPTSNISEFETNLFIGAIPEDVEEYLTFLNEFKIDSIINMSHENYYINDINVYSYPIDEKINEKDKLLEAVDKLNELISNEKRIFLHCLLGRNRSASVLLLYLMKYRNKSLLESYLEVYSKRNICISKELGKHIYDECSNNPDEVALFRITADTINCDNRGNEYYFSTYGLDFYELKKIKEQIVV
jgi:hypothetical protein